MSKERLGFVAWTLTQLDAKDPAGDVGRFYKSNNVTLTWMEAADRKQIREDFRKRGADNELRRAFDKAWRMWRDSV